MQQGHIESGRHKVRSNLLCLQDILTQEYLKGPGEVSGGH